MFHEFRNRMTKIHAALSRRVNAIIPMKTRLRLTMQVKLSIPVFLRCIPACGIGINGLPRRNHNVGNEQFDRPLSQAKVREFFLIASKGEIPQYSGLRSSRFRRHASVLPRLEMNRGGRRIEVQKRKQKHACVTCCHSNDASFIPGHPLPDPVNFRSLWR